MIRLSESEESEASEPDISLSAWPTPSCPRSRFQKHSLRLKRKSGVGASSDDAAPIPSPGSTAPDQSLDHPPMPPGRTSLQHQRNSENDLFSTSCKWWVINAREICYFCRYWSVFVMGFEFYFRCFSYVSVFEAHLTNKLDNCGILITVILQHSNFNSIHYIILYYNIT